jgi:hypothetical protein
VGEGASVKGDTASIDAAPRPGLSIVRCDLPVGSSVVVGVCEIGKLDNDIPRRSRASSSKQDHAGVLNVSATYVTVTS